MIIDPSALLSILQNESDSERFIEAITRAQSRRLSAAGYVEASCVLDSIKDPVASRHLDLFLDTARITIEPVTAAQAKLAREAYRDFGKSSGHLARLNFGDCFSYALAKVYNESLLFKGKDFSKTDIVSAV